MGYWDRDTGSKVSTPTIPAPVMTTTMKARDGRNDKPMTLDQVIAFIQAARSAGFPGDTVVQFSDDSYNVGYDRIYDISVSTPKPLTPQDRV